MKLIYGKKAVIERFTKKWDKICIEIKAQKSRGV